LRKRRWLCSRCWDYSPSSNVPTGARS
jgi:hypothetical protein